MYPFILERRLLAYSLAAFVRCLAYSPQAILPREPPSGLQARCVFVRSVENNACRAVSVSCRGFCSTMKKAVEAAIHSMRGLQGRDQRLQEWKSKAYSLSNAEARVLSAKLLGGKQVCSRIRNLLIFLTHAAGANCKDHETTLVVAGVGPRPPDKRVQR